MRHLTAQEVPGGAPGAIVTSARRPAGNPAPVPDFAALTGRVCPRGGSPGTGPAPPIQAAPRLTEPCYVSRNRKPHRPQNLIGRDPYRSRITPSDRACPRPCASVRLRGFSARAEPGGGHSRNGHCARESTCWEGNRWPVRSHGWSDPGWVAPTWFPACSEYSLAWSACPGWSCLTGAARRAVLIGRLLVGRWRGSLGRWGP